MDPMLVLRAIWKAPQILVGILAFVAFLVGVGIGLVRRWRERKQKEVVDHA